MCLPDSISRQNRLFAQKKEKNTYCLVTVTNVIAGPTCLIAHLLAPHDRAFSRRKVIIHYGVFLLIQLYNRGGLAEGEEQGTDQGFSKADIYVCNV